MEGELGAAALRAIPLVDLTSLGDDDTDTDIEELCAAAPTPFGPVAAVCVWPQYVGLAVSRLEWSPISVASVANFPDGLVDIDRAVSDARRIVDAGGDEVDVVFPWQALADGRTDAGRELVSATRHAVGDDVGLKVILESGQLGDPDLIEAAAREALDGGADFLKTSTGTTPISATPEAARVLLHVLRSHDREAGLSVSGGVRTTAQAAEYLALADEIMGPDWVSRSTFRFGASSLLDDMIATAGGKP